MTEKQTIPTRYFTFKLDNYVYYLDNITNGILIVIATECQPNGPTFEDIVNLTGLGPRRIKATLKYLFDKNYIITNHQIASIKEKQGIDAFKLRTFPSR